MTELPGQDIHDDVDWDWDPPGYRSIDLYAGMGALKVKYQRQGGICPQADDACWTKVYGVRQPAASPPAPLVGHGRGVPGRP